ncbi:hypothetical protein CRM22_000660 [Opisthorchis felineus]|uniref:Large ribosomal subunit protein uL22m n=1 Tax=Opisthorchis felineus TaxID=147828 RepID=A0A4S2MIH2_OPIFE|nr:hypothetical protein CRM22_000660 [Opisthorchis felineus]
MSPEFITSGDVSQGCPVSQLLNFGRGPQIPTHQWLNSLATRLPLGLSRLSRLAVAAVPHLPFVPIAQAHSQRPAASNHTRIISKATGRKEDLWQLYNEVVYPPKVPVGNKDVASFVLQERRPGEVTHRREDLLYSQKKLWLLGFMIRGKSVDDAFAQLAHRPEKGARILEEVLEEAIELAVKEHDFEYCTKIWVETVHVSRGRGVPRLYKGVRGQLSANNYHYANLYVRLREGDPPPVYHPRQVKGSWTPTHNCPSFGRPSWGSGNDMLQLELERMRQRRLKTGM